MYKAALFDLDGVVFDTEAQYTSFWGRQCREFHPELPGLEHTIKGQTLTQIYERYFSGDYASTQPVITSRLDDFEAQMTFDYVLGFVDFVRQLRHNGIKTAVVTSSNIPKMRNVYAKKTEFESLFDIVLTSERFARSKPHPDCYISAALALDIQRDDCLVFEDSYNGMKSGRAAGMTVVGVATTYSSDDIAPYSDYVISDFRDPVLHTLFDIQ